MARIAPITFEEAAPVAQATWKREVAARGRMTNMKRTLARSPLALEIYLQWYPLRDEVERFLGKRLTILFVHAISTEADCLVCSTYFRRHLIDAGEDPDALHLDDKEQAFVAFGQQIARDPHGVTDALFQSITRYLTPHQVVTLTAFAGQMVATNLINDVLEVDLDDYLNTYRPLKSP